MILTRTEQSILNAISRNPGLHTNELAMHVWPEQNTAQPHLNEALRKVLLSMHSRSLLAENNDEDGLRISETGQAAILALL